MGIETPKHGCLARSSEFALELNHLFPWAQLPPLSSVPLVKRLKTLCGKKASARAVVRHGMAQCSRYRANKPLSRQDLQAFLILLDSLARSKVPSSCNDYRSLSDEEILLECGITEESAGGWEDLGLGHGKGQHAQLPCSNLNHLKHAETKTTGSAVSICLCQHPSARSPPFLWAPALMAEARRERRRPTPSPSYSDGRYGSQMQSGSAKFSWVVWSSCIFSVARRLGSDCNLLYWVVPGPNSLRGLRKIKHKRKKVKLAVLTQSSISPHWLWNAMAMDGYGWCWGRSKGV